MDNNYLIIDQRPTEQFKDKTFSGFKKRMFSKNYLKVWKKIKLKIHHFGYLNVLFQDIHWN